jgi:hypothetical protein
MSTSRIEQERLCAFDFIASACCTHVPENRGELIQQGLLRQITKYVRGRGFPRIVAVAVCPFTSVRGRMCVAGG